MDENIIVIRKNAYGEMPIDFEQMLLELRHTYKDIIYDVKDIEHKLLNGEKILYIKEEFGYEYFLK
ncbi:hypothetical protein KAS33_02515 [bacterium]|nr:hypothetical protein [bacterium]